MAIEKLSVVNFTAFENLRLDFHPGMNVLIGDNGTGKTHLMKLLYSLCSVTTPSGKSGKKVMDKLVSVFLPSGNQAQRLINRQPGRRSCEIAAVRDGVELSVRFNSLWKETGQEEITGLEPWLSRHIESVYIPVKEMLANAPGFTALYDRLELHFEEVYKDIVALASIPVPRGPTGAAKKQFLKILEKAIAGTVIQEPSGEFFLRNKQGNLEFTLLSEGMRKLALLSLLIRNDVLSKGTVLFWDEPEANMNPAQTRMIVQIMKQLSEQGVQIFVATHDYMTAKEIDMTYAEEDSARFLSFYRNAEGAVEYATSPRFEGLANNRILDAFDEQFSRYVGQALTE